MCPDANRPGATRPDTARAAGWRVALTGAAGRDAELAAAIAGEGGIALVHPMIAYEPAPATPESDAALGGLARYDWVVFTSAAAVECFGRLHRRAGGAPLPRLAAVGPATARAAQATLEPPALLSTSQTGHGLAAELLAAGARGPVLLPGADIASPDLAAELRAAGVTVEELTVYRTLPGPGAGGLADAIEAGAVDVILLASPSAARALAHAVASGIGGGPEWVPPVVCIGPSTGDEAVRLGFDVTAVAARHDRAGLLDALLEWIDLHPELRHAASR